MEILEIKTRNPEGLSQDLRSGTAPFLGQRRAVVGLSFAASGAMIVVALYQMGILKHVPEPDLPHFDADKVDASEEAYGHLEVGDAFLGLVSYGVTATLAAMGPSDRSQRKPLLPLILTGKAVIDTLQAARLTRDQWTKHRAFCSWCLAAAAATFASLPLTLPEARSAVASLWSSRSDA